VKKYEKLFLTEKEEADNAQNIPKVTFEEQLDEEIYELKTKKMNRNFKKIFKSIQNLQSYLSNDIKDVQDLRQFIEELRKLERTKPVRLKQKPLTLV